MFGRARLDRGSIFPGGPIGGHAGVVAWWVAGRAWVDEERRASTGEPRVRGELCESIVELPPWMKPRRDGAQQAGLGFGGARKI